jgi:uncharacterized BrkB/YihY/UPF0761 family membrane protein
MVLAVVLIVFLIVLGLAMCGYGVVLATGKHRPLDFIGAVLAAAGLAIAMLGVGRLLAQRFFSG